VSGDGVGHGVRGRRVRSGRVGQTRSADAGLPWLVLPCILFPARTLHSLLCAAGDAHLLCTAAVWVKGARGAQVSREGLGKGGCVTL
jgi:hypothetical protein